MEFVQIKNVAQKRSIDLHGNGDTHWLLNLDMIEQQTGRILDYIYVPTEKIGASTTYFDIGCVLYSKLRPNLNKVVLPDRHGFATSELIPIYPDKTKITRDYLCWFLRSPCFVSFACSKTAGAKMPRLNPSTLMDAKIPLPPLPVQRSIVAKLDAVCDLIAKRKEQIEDLHRLAKSKFTEMFGDPCIPGSPHSACGQIFRLGNLTSIHTGRLDANASSPDGEYPFFTCSKDPLRISSYSYDCECALVAGNGDLNVKYYNGKFDAYQRTYIIQSKDKNILQVPFLYWFLVLYVAELRRLSIGGVIKYIKLGNLTEALILVPSLVVQQEFADFVAKLDETEAGMKKSLGELEALKKSMMQTYFG